MRPKDAKSGSELLQQRKARMAAAPPVLQGGFRPFFLAAGVWAVVAIALWMCAIEGIVAVPRGVDPLAWHRHEMVFGFAGAAVAGFVLTAIPNWTGRFPIAGLPLAGLVSLWATARVLLLVLPVELAFLAALFDTGLFVALAAYAFREVRLARNRNFPIAALVLLFGLADALDYGCVLGVYDDVQIGARAGLAILMVMISLIGGRIIPSFTSNWLKKAGIQGRLPGQTGRFDIAVVALTVVSALLWVIGPGSRVTGVLLVASGGLQLVRLARWRGLATMSEPLLLVLHVGYAWLGIALVLLGAGILTGQIPQSAAMHALGVGAAGTMIFAVMTRASLGHTGRALQAPRAIAFAYFLLTGAALTRVITAMGWIGYLAGLRVASALWMVAFAVFLICYVPILTRPRQSG